MDCIFCKIIHNEIPASVIHDDADVIVIKYIKPKAPSHLLILPKKHIATINDITEDDTSLLGHMVVTAKQIAKQQGFSDFGYRLVFNVNPGGGQDVYHIHLHLLGGRQMTWPPG